MEMTHELFALFFITLGQAERAERWRREPQKVPENLDDNLDLGGDEDRNVFEDQGVVNEDFDGVEDDAMLLRVITLRFVEGPGEN